MKRAVTEKISINTYFLNLAQSVRSTGYGFLLAVVLLTLFSCSSAFTAIQPMVDYSNVVIYRLSQTDYPDSDIAQELKPVENFPDISEENLKGLLSSFRYHRDTVWGISEQNVYPGGALDFVVPAILQQIPRLQDGDRMVVISKYDEDKAVLSRDERNTMILWLDGDGFNVLFGEIREELPVVDPLDYDTWKDVLPVSAEQAYPDLTLVPSSHFQYKIIHGKLHRTWAVVPADTLSSFKPASSNGASEENAPGSGKPPRNGEDTLTRRLTDLKEAHDKGLVTDEEYEKKRKSIIDQQ